jgi:cell division protease FtsH
MICEWGMSDLLGPMTFGKQNEEIFLGREIQSHRDYSEATARMIDEELVKIIRTAQKRARGILDEHEKILHLLAEELIKYETIDEADMKRILSGKKVIRRKNNEQQTASKTKPPAKRKIQKSKTLTKKPIIRRKPRTKTLSS